MKQYIGFLSPEGDFYECSQYEHIKLSEKIVKEKSLYSESTSETQTILANNGWCFFQSNYAGIPAEINPQPKFTDEQISWIMKHHEELNQKQKYFISEKLKLDEEDNDFLPRELTNVNYPGIIF